jgi:hypothetical protein
MMFDNYAYTLIIMAKQYPDNQRTERAAVTLVGDVGVSPHLFIRIISG